MNNNQNPNSSGNINNKNYSMYIHPSLLSMNNNINDNIPINNNTIQKDNNISEVNNPIYINPYLNQMNYQQQDLNNLMSTNNFNQNDNFNSQPIYANNLYQQNINKRNNNQYNLNGVNTLGNNNNIKQLPNYNNNINSIGNTNFANNIKNNRINIVPQIYEQEGKQPILREINPIPNYNNFEMNNKMNLNLNNSNQYSQNTMTNRNNIINYSPISNTNLYPQNSNFPNVYNPAIMKNNPINLKNNLSLSSQSAKNTNPNFNINTIDNINPNFMQNLPFKINNQNGKILISNVGDKQNNVPFHVNFPNNLSLNNFMMKNNINNFHYDNNNHNNKNNLYGRKKKDYNPEFNDNMKKSNSNNRINNNYGQLKNVKDRNLNYLQNKRINKLLQLNIKKGDKIINFDIYPDNYADTIKKIKSEFGVNDNYINLILDKMKIAIDFSKEVFKSNINNYSYKQITNLIQINETKKKRYIGTNRKSKSIKGKYLFNIFKNNDIKLNIYDIKKNANLNNSF